MVGDGDKSKVDIFVDFKTANGEYNAAMQSVNGITKGAWDNLGVYSKQFGANSAGRLARLYPPISGGIKKAEKTLEIDINEIFKPLEDIPFPSLVLAKQWTAVKHYNYEFTSKKLKKAMDEGKMNVLYNAFAYSSKKSEYKPFEGEINLLSEPNRAAHSLARDSDGRPNGKVYHIMGKRKQAEAAILAYSQMMKKNVGKMVGGWIVCYKRLGGKGLSFPSRIAKNGIGTAKYMKGKDMIEVSCQNKYGNFNKFMEQRKGMFMSIMDEEAKKVIKSHVDFTRNEAKKFIIKPKR